VKSPRTSAADFPWETVLDRLSALYGDGNWRVPYLRDHAEDPFQVLVGTILSQRTRDANTDRASAALFAQYPDADSLAKAPPAKVERLIHGTGFYRTKAANIRACAREIRDRFGGTVPRDIDTLLTLPGVGRKTANCVIVFGFGEPGIPVDTHVFRIAHRFGLIHERTPEAAEEALRRIVPRDLWIPLNPLLVQHGQNLCRPRQPRCELCPLIELCPTGRARRDGGNPPLAADRVRAPHRRGGTPPRPTRVPSAGKRRRRPTQPAK
jgi:endonuclease-3